MNTWRALPSGKIEVNGAVPGLIGSGALLFDANVARWAPMASSSAAKYRLPISWLLGMIYAESGGNPKAVSPAGAIGLTQLYSATAKDGHSNAEILSSPELQIDLGAKHLAKCHRSDYVRALSAYNAGGPHVDNGSPWGLKSEPGYVARAIAAQNYATNLKPSKPEKELATVDGWSMVGASVALLAAAAYWGHR